MMRIRRQGVSALLAGLASSAVTPRAFASGHVPGGPLILLAAFWVLLPGIVLWVIGLGTHLGPPSGWKFLFGFPCSLGATIFCFLVPDDGTSFSSFFVVAGVLGALAAVAHVVRFAIHLFSRATGGRNKEVLKRWWRHL